MRSAARIADRFKLDPLAVLDTPLLDSLLRVAAADVCNADDRAAHEAAKAKK